MRVNFTFRNLEPSDGIKNYAEDKITKLQKYLHAPLDVEITLSLERHLHRADVTVAADGHHHAAHEESEDMYASIDLVVDKLDRQLRDAKAAEVDRRRHAVGVAKLADELD
ncbi:MAG: ribosome hibernation-promoting factor, HPF/YfiA family [Myxococcota bacterium]